MHGKVLSGRRKVVSNRPRGRQAEKIPKGEILYFTETLENVPECIQRHFCVDGALAELVQELGGFRCCRFQRSSQGPVQLRGQPFRTNPAARKVILTVRPDGA